MSCDEPRPTIRLAVRSDVDTVRSISAGAYIAAYVSVIGAIPEPAQEDYRPRIERGEVWLLEAPGPVGVLVLEPDLDALLIYSVAVSPAFQRRGYAGLLLPFVDTQARPLGVAEIRLVALEVVTSKLVTMIAALQVQSILRVDLLRWRLMDVVRSLDLPDCWIGAGFVRNAVWDHLHGRHPAPPAGDIDVIWHDPDRTDPEEDRKYEAALQAREASFAWSVKNQARMHKRNGDAPYASAAEAMRFWPETATAVAARRHGHDGCELAALFGLGDLLGLVLRPTPRFSCEKQGVYEARSRTKGWTTEWPLLREPKPHAGHPTRLQRNRLVGQTSRRFI